MRQKLFLLMAIGALSGCISKPTAPVIPAISDAEKRAAEAREHQNFLTYAERYLAAMQEPLSLTNGLQTSETVWRFMFIPQIGDEPVICIRVDSSRDWIITVKALTRRSDEPGSPPGRMLYCHQDVLSPGEVAALDPLIRGLASWPPEPTSIMALDGAEYTVEEAHSDRYFVAMRNTPDPKRFAAFLRRPGVLTSLRETEPTFNQEDEIAVQQRFVKLTAWFAQKTGLWSLSDQRR